MSEFLLYVGCAAMGFVQGWIAGRLLFPKKRRRK